MLSHREKIDAFIQLEKKASFPNYWLSNFRFSDLIVAEKRGRLYILWKSDRWSQLMFSVFYITFNQEGMITKIHEEINLVGKWIKYLYFAFVLLLVGYHTYDEIIYPRREYFMEDFILYAVILIFFYAIYKAVEYGRRVWKQKMTDQLKIVIGLETKASLQEKEDAKSEWTGGKIVTRMIMYPLCLFLIFVGVYMLFFDNASRSLKVILSGLTILLLCGGYFVLDIKAIMKKRKK
jgi:hypothetical protein